MTNLTPKERIRRPVRGPVPIGKLELPAEVSPDASPDLTIDERIERSMLADPVERLAYTIPEAARALGVSDFKIRSLIETGDLPCSKLARRVLVRKVDLEALLARSLRGGAA